MPTAGTDQATRRAVVVIVLLILAASALQGYLPGRQQDTRTEPSSSTAALIADVVLLAISVAIVATAVLLRLRNRRAVRAAGEPLSTRSRGAAARPTWRFLLIILAVIVAWLLVMVLISRLGGHLGMRQSLPANDPAGTAPPTSAPPPPPRPAEPESGGNVFGYLAGSTVIMLLLAAAGTVIAARRQRRVARPYPIYDPPAALSGQEGTESLARAAELGLAEIGDLSREPREAIIACYATMERELTNVPEVAPRDFDTPTEVLARAVEHHALHADSAAQLVDLFEEARFSPHVMNEGHRDVAVGALRAVLAELASRSAA